VTDTTTLDAAAGQVVAEKPRRSGALSTMKVAELQGLAASMGITGTAKMRKGDLVSAIKARQSGASAPTTGGAAEQPQRAEQPKLAEQTPRSEVPTHAEQAVAGGDRPELPLPLRDRPRDV